MSYLSASQINTLFRCPREWAWKYILKIKERPTEAKSFGSAFHRITAGQTADLGELRGFDAEYPWDAALSVMTAGWREAVKTLNDPIGQELTIETPMVKLVVDEVRMDNNDGWFIVEKKTASTLSEHKRRFLVDDPQLLMYAGHASLIADHFMLTPDRFSGVMYTVTLKPTERKKAKETPTEFAARLTSSTEILAYDREAFSNAPRKVANLLAFADRRRNEIFEAYETNKDPRDVPANTAMCVRYGSACGCIDYCFGVCEPGTSAQGKTPEVVFEE